MFGSSFSFHSDTWLEVNEMSSYSREQSLPSESTHLSISDLRTDSNTLCVSVISERAQFEFAENELPLSFLKTHLMLSVFWIVSPREVEYGEDSSVLHHHHFEPAVAAWLIRAPSSSQFQRNNLTP